MTDRRKLQARIEQVLHEIGRLLAPDAIANEDKLSTTAWLVALAVADLLSDEDAREAAGRIDAPGFDRDAAHNEEDTDV